MSAPAVAVTQDGKRFAAAWKDVREGSPRVWWAFASEPKFPKEAAISEEPRVERDHPSIAADEGGTFWTAWEDGSGPAVRVRARSSAPKAAARDVSDAAQGAAGFPVVACGAGLVVVAWESTDRTAGDRVFVRMLEDARR